MKRLLVVVLWVAWPAWPDTVSFRVVFGENQARARDYSGKVALSAGRVTGITGWRFFGADRVEGPDGWKLLVKPGQFENQPNAPSRIEGSGAPRNLVPAGVDITVEAPLAATAAIRDWKFALRDLDYRRVLVFGNGEATVQRTPLARAVSAETGEEHDHPSLAVARDGAVWVAWQAYRDRGDQVYAHRLDTPQTHRLTDAKGDVYRTVIAEDGAGRIWVVWSERAGRDWHLYARAFDGKAWSPRQQLTRGTSPNLFHRLVRSPQGTLHLVWVGFENGASRVLWSRLVGDAWSAPVDVSGPSAWAPDAACDSKGALYVAWDSYRTGNYDVFLRRIDGAGAPGPIQQVTSGAEFQAHPSVAVDRQDRVWLAWDESGANWGKDWTHDDPWRSTVLYADRRPRIAVFDNGRWKQPAANLLAAVPRRWNRFIQMPRIVCDRTGRIWVSLQLRTSAANNREDFWASGGRWERFLTTLEADGWTPIMPVPASGARNEGPFGLEVGPRGVWMAWAADNRPFAAAPRAQQEGHYSVVAGSFDSPPAAPAALDLEDYSEPEPRSLAVHPNEAEDVARIRAYRATLGGTTYRIVRGDFHRHTEISGDGAGDGSLEDWFRYMYEVAAMDTGIIADHNAGNDNEYTWWRTEKAHDSFLVPGRFIPLFGYERSVPYPNGHRNVVFPQRGVRTLPISPPEAKGAVNSGGVLYPYLKQNRGVCMLHSLATSQGSDFRDNDPEVEPLVEIYQGYHASYEYEGAPRAETPNYLVRVHGAFQPAGFYWNALNKGFKLGVQSSSDHVSTHTSYAMIYTPAGEREAIVDSMRKRHAYGATDNIIVDFRAVDAAGRVYLMGDAFEAAAAPKLQVKLVGTDRILAAEIVKDGRFVYRTEPNDKSPEFTFIDNNAGGRESYYYVRVIQIDRNMAWSSPIWVKYTGR